MKKEEAIKWLTNLKSDIGKIQFRALWDYAQAIDEIIKLLSAEPSGDRPKGEWIDVEHEPFCECSVRGAYIENLDDDFAFCPRCGAEMK